MGAPSPSPRASSSSSSPAFEEDVLLPFRRSRESRRAHSARTRALLSAAARAEGGASREGGVVVARPLLTTLPNLEREDERRPASAFVVRALSTKERAALLDPQGCGCRLASDDADVRVMYRVAGNGEGPAMRRWDVSSSLKAQVRNTTFGGNVVLGVLLEGPDAVKEAVPSKLSELVGVSDNGLIRDCILEPGCAVHRNAEVSETHAMKYAAIIGCGTVSCPRSGVEKSKEECNFDLAEGSMDVEVGPEAGGGRVVNVRVESTLVDVCKDLRMDSNGGTIAPLVSFEKGDVPHPAMIMNVLCPHSSLLHTPRTSHVHLAPHSKIDSATSVSSAVLLPHSTIRDGCAVSHALLQWHSVIASHSDARRVVLMEHSEVGPHSFTANAIFGPDSHVSGGEVHCTLFGPNANSHHQSLLIGILWPLGRGNVGYGSNVGSNHTGRIPDQETSVGEGTFWGLGSVIKFPVDLTSAPYSIVAAGVQLPPQRIALPFSLITDGPGGMNQLTPGWLLRYSPYTVARSEAKFASRRKAKRHDFYTGWKIIRPGVVDMMVEARDALVRAGGERRTAGEASGPVSKEKKAVFRTDRAVPGLGANQLAEKGRKIGIGSYTDAIQRYALRGLLDRLVALAPSQKGLPTGEVLRRTGLDRAWSDDSLGAVHIPPPSEHAVDWPILPWNEASFSDAEALWRHQRQILVRELPSVLRDDGGGVLSRLLEKCVSLEDDHARRVHESKSRDDARGAATVPGYEDAHVAAGEDPVVLAAKEEAERVREDARIVGEALGASGVARSRL